MKTTMVNSGFKGLNVCLDKASDPDLRDVIGRDGHLVDGFENLNVDVCFG